MNAGDDRRRERIRWHCRRGMLELDLILVRAFEHHYDTLSEPELDQFEKLLSLEDPVLLRYLHEGEEPVDFELKQLVQKIR
ncbi:MAG TPA: succinate dehydrogenase assembly factor 2 [Burkholderiales bacterium]|nr:succinate dehydrogenase assembly factor 2 [Burkholderiales bacterium]